MAARYKMIGSMDILFDIDVHPIIIPQLKYGKVKIEIYKKYKLAEVIQAHKDLESRKIIGPAIIIP